MDVLCNCSKLLSIRSLSYGSHTIGCNSSAFLAEAVLWWLKQSALFIFLLILQTMLASPLSEHSPYLQGSWLQCVLPCHDHSPCLQSMWAHGQIYPHMWFTDQDNCLTIKEPSDLRHRCTLNWALKYKILPFAYTAGFQYAGKMGGNLLHLGPYKSKQKKTSL